MDRPQQQQRRRKARMPNSIDCSWKREGRWNSIEHIQKSIKEKIDIKMKAQMHKYSLSLYIALYLYILFALSKAVRLRCKEERKRNF
jgi:hypothetical protein